MKVNLTLAALLLFMPHLVCATENQPELFLYSLQEPTQEAPQALLDHGRPTANGCRWWC